MPYFVAANHDTEIRPFAQLVEPGTRPRYEPFQAGAHLERMLRRDFPYLRERQRRLQTLGLMPQDKQILNPFENRIARSTT